MNGIPVLSVLHVSVFARSDGIPHLFDNLVNRVATSVGLPTTPPYAGLPLPLPPRPHRLITAMPAALMSFQHPDSAAPLTRYISPTPSSRFRLPGDTISGALTGQPHSMIRPAPAPHPLGKKGVSFPFTSATPHDQEQTAHESGWRVSIHLNREGRGEEGEDAASRWRTGEALNGAVEVKKIEGSTTHKKITSVIVRAYWQSTTFYHMVSVVQPEGGTKSKKSSLLGSKPNVRMDHRAEWHRGYCNGGGEGTELWHGGELEEIQREVEGDFPLLDASTAATTTASSATGTSADATASPRCADGEAEDDIPSRTTLPFNFTIPTSTRVTVSNVSPQPPATRRSLQLFQRTPPASLPGSACRNGCVEWTVEVLVRFESDEVPTPSSSGSISPPFPRAVDELPSFDSATNAATELSDNFGLARTGPNLIAHRIVFPYEPSDHHAMDLYSHWRPVVKGPWAAVTAKFAGIPLDEIEDTRPVLGVVVPSFGRDPRDEALGGTFMGPKRPMRGLYVEREGGRSRWSSFEKRKGLKNVLGRLMGHIRSEVSRWAVSYAQSDRN
jgi:hypothetical protein